MPGRGLRVPVYPWPRKIFADFARFRGHLKAAVGKLDDGGESNLSPRPHRYSRPMAFYRLPGFVAETLSSQPKLPRRIPIQSIVLAVLDGADCAIYAGGAVVFVAFGLTVMTGSFGVTPAPISASSIFVGVGLILGLLVAFRV